MANGAPNPNVVAGFGDLTDPETMLYYKLHLAMALRDQQLKNPNCSASQLYPVIQKITLLRAQLTQLHDSGIKLQAPLQADIDNIKNLASQVEKLTNDAAGQVAGLALIGQVAAATSTLAGV